jgi:hypothetical protein
MLKAVVSIIDKRLRARDGIFEYSNSPRCLFRVHFAVSSTDIALADGTRISRNSRIIHLHLWNEHIPPFPARGPTLSWARRLTSDLETSLEELADFIASRPDLEDIAAVGGTMTFGSIEQTQLVAHLAGRYGFVRAADPAHAHSIAERLHVLGENVLISMIVIAHNPAAFRTDCFRHDRMPVYVHRTELIRRFGGRRISAN